MAFKQFNREHTFPDGMVRATSDIPAQAIPSKKKTKEWLEETLDSLESIGIRQVRDNLKFKDHYRMVDGKVSYMELKDVIPHMSNIEDDLKDLGISTWFKHYDIAGVIINAFLGWFSGLSDKYYVEGIDDQEKNEYLFNKTNLLVDYIRQKWDQMLSTRLIEMGMDPNLEDFETEEERQAYMEQVTQAKISMMPHEIQEYMDSTWSSAGVAWGKETLHNDRQRFDMDGLDRESFKDYLCSGRWFRHIHVGYDYYKPENWSPIETFFSRNLDNKFPQYGEYIGRIHDFTGTQVINRWGHKITAKKKQEILGGRDEFHGSHGRHSSRKNGDFVKPRMTGWFGTEITPFQNYHDYLNVSAFESMTGQPAGMYNYLSDGEHKAVPRFLPSVGFNPGYRSSAWASDDPLVRDDMYRCTETYWVSYKQIYIVNYQSESGLVMKSIVTDELFDDFLKENGIKKITRCLDDKDLDEKVNTYYVDYVPEVRFGVKISGGNLSDDSLYLYGDPIDHQVCDTGGMFDHVLPVFGYNGSCMFDRIMPYQSDFNLAMNQLKNLMEKEIGVFVLFDINFIPGQFKNSDDMESSYAEIMNLAKDFGLLGADMSKQNTLEAGNGGTPFNQFAKYDLSLSGMMKSRIEIAMNAKRMALETIGISPQILGTPTGYETAEGVKQGVNSFMLQTMIYFDEFDSGKIRGLNLHLNAAQQCLVDGKDSSIFYTGSDLVKSYLELSADEIKHRRLAVRIISNSRERKRVEELKMALMQLNTIGADMLDFASILTSDTVGELKDAAIKSRKNADRIRQETEAANQRSMSKQMELEASIDDREHKQAVELEHIKGTWKVATANARRPEADEAPSERVADTSKIIASAADNATKRSGIESKERVDMARIDSDSKSAEEDRKIKLQELRLKMGDLRERMRRTETMKFNSIINKA